LVRAIRVLVRKSRQLLIVRNPDHLFFASQYSGRIRTGALSCRSITTADFCYVVCFISIGSFAHSVSKQRLGGVAEHAGPGSTGEWIRLSPLQVGRTPQYDRSRKHSSRDHDWSGCPSHQTNPNWLGRNSAPQSRSSANCRNFPCPGGSFPREDRSCFGSSLRCGRSGRTSARKLLNVWHETNC
jgi:hypothetical protein